MTDGPSANLEKEPTLNPLLSVERVSKSFVQQSNLLRKRSTSITKAVDNVSFAVSRGETFGLVGESGSGKSTVARCVARLTDLDGGRIVYDGEDITRLESRHLRLLRRRLQIVFQDPLAALDPRMSAGAIIEEPLIVHRVGERAERRRLVAEMLELVGLASHQARRKPHEFSGGQRQRIALARALVLRPELVILDEPVSALDVSIQAQILNLLRDLQRELHLTYLFIVHDLAVAEYFCDRLAVMYRGAVVETGTRQDLFRAPLHPYTVALLAAVPAPDPTVKVRKDVIASSAIDEDWEGIGCRFRGRCVVGRDREVCAEVDPGLDAKVHSAACHFAGALSYVPGGDSEEAHVSTPRCEQGSEPASPEATKEPAEARNE